MLQYIPDELFKSKYFKVIPKQLKSKLISNTNNTSSLIDQLSVVLEILKIENKNWLLTFNGHIEIESCFNLTVDHLLNITGQDEFIQLISFLQLQNISKQKKVICEEEILLDKYESYKETDQYIPKEMLEILHEVKNVAPISRIEPDLTLLYDNKLWVRPNDYKMNKENVQELNSRLKCVFGENSYYRFQFGAHYQRVTTTLLMSSDEQLYEYCRNFCAFIKEVDPSIDIKYVVDSRRNPPRRLFRFNDEISVHPRSFFHMRNAKSFIEAMNYYSTSRDAEDKKIKRFLKLIAKIKQEEGFEFESLKTFIFKELGKVFFDKNYEDYIKNHLPFVYSIIVNDEDQMYNVQNIQLGSIKIFSRGNLNSLIKAGKSGPQLSYTPKFILIALRVASDVQPELGFKSVSHLVSLINAIKEYCDGKRPETQKIIKSATSKTIEKIWQSEDEYKDMLNVFIKEILMIAIKSENLQHAYRLSSISSSLHHWFKHGQDYASFDDYCSEMNEFFGSCKNYFKEVDTQDGVCLIRTFSNQKYYGILIDEFDKATKTLQNAEHSISTFKSVITFFKDSGLKEKKQKAKALKIEEEKKRPYDMFTFHEKFLQKCLLITEEPLFNYNGEKIENVGLYLEDKQITHLTTLLSSYTFKQENRVQKVLLALNDKYRHKKIKTEQDMEKNLDRLLNALVKAFPNAQITICKLPQNDGKIQNISQLKINELLKKLIYSKNGQLKYLDKDLGSKFRSDTALKIFLENFFS